MAFDARLLTAQGDEGLSFRVILGPYSDLEDAEEAAANVETTFGLDSSVNVLQSDF